MVRGIVEAGESPLPEREATLATLAHQAFDVLVVGGGISGSTVAYLAAVAGLRVALVEQGDFSSGTSGRSSRLVHGGFRYLAQGRFGLVRRLLRARHELAAAAPHLVRAVPFLLPFWNDGPHRPLVLRLAMSGYRALGARGSVRRALSSSETAACEPLLQGAAVSGALAYDEFVTHDARLVIETVLAARDAGAVVANHLQFTHPITAGDGVAGARVLDRRSGHAFAVNARVIVNATGPWVDMTAAAGARPSSAPARVRLSRGTHVVLPGRRLPLRNAVVLFSRRDGRALFALPRDGFTLIGTTEVPHHGTAGNVRPTGAEVDELIGAVAHAFPRQRLGKHDVVAAFAGVRPLDSEGGKMLAGADLGAADRNYAIAWQAPGVLALWGGKLTLARDGARQTLSMLRRARRPLGLPDFTVPRTGEVPPLPGARWRRPPGELRRRLMGAGLDAASAEHVLGTYGGRSTLLLAILLADPATRRPIVSGAPHVIAEAVLARRHELATCVQDFTRRRSDLALRLPAECAAPSVALAEVFRPRSHDESAPSHAHQPTRHTGDAA